jgi:hypothetical protein
LDRLFYHLGDELIRAVWIKTRSLKQAQPERTLLGCFFKATKLLAPIPERGLIFGRVQASKDGRALLKANRELGLLRQRR